MIRALFFCAVLAGSAAASDATIVKMSGPVSILPEGSKKFFAAKGGEGLIFGDTIRVGKGGVAQVTIADRGAVLLREESVMTLRGSPAKVTLSFKVGEFLIGLRRKLERGQSFKVRTASSVAAVRGTLFWGKSDEKKTTTYAGLGHEIAVTAKGKTVIVAAGQTTTIEFGAAPAAPKPHDIPFSYLDNFKVDGGLQGLETLAEKR